MANIYVGNLPTAVGVLTTDQTILERGGVTYRANVGDIANTATAFVPTSRTITAGFALSGGGALSSDITINFDISDLSAITSMLITDQFMVNDVAADLPRKITFQNSMKSIAGLPATGALNLSADKFVVVKASDGLSYSATASQISLAAGNVPAGGTTAQVLAKASNTDYDTVWQSSAFADQAANIVFAGPASGGAVQPAFRALVGADLPNPAAATKGGVFSYAAVSNQFLTQIGTSGAVASAQPAFTNISGIATVAQGGTGLSSGTSGGVLGYTASGTLASSVALTANALVLGGGAGATPTPLGSLGTTTTVLHGNAAGAPTFGAVSLTADVSGVLPLANGGTNANLTASNGGLFYSTATAGAILSGTATAGQIPRSGASSAPAWSTSTYPATSAAGTILASGTANTITASATPTLGIAGTTLGTLSLTGNTSGTVLITPQATAGSPTLTLPNTSGTFAASATAPITLSATTGAIGITGSALTRVDDTNVTLTLGGTPTTALLAATSITAGWSGQLSLARGGTNANLTASNGGIFYSTGSAGAILSGTATAGQHLQSGASAAPSWTTATYPATTTINRLLYSSAANTITDLATANGGMLNASSSGVPSVTITPTLGVQQTSRGTLTLANTAAGAFPVTIQSSNSATQGWTLTLPTTDGANGEVLQTDGNGVTSWVAVGGTGTVTSVSFTGGLISVATATTTPALTVAGTSGGIPYFSSGSTWASSAALAANAIVLGGGAGAAPATTTTGTGVVTALGVNTGSSGAFVVNGGALGTPSGGTLTNATGLPVSTGISGLGTGVATMLASATGATVALTYIIDGGGATITTGSKFGIMVPFACTITRWTIGLNASGSIVIDIWKDTQANYPPTVADTITASAKPTVTTATTATSATLTGWTTTVAAGDWLYFNVDSVTTAQWANITLTCTKT